MQDIEENLAKYKEIEENKRQQRLAAKANKIDS
jgi:hypothetical protein